jgi:transcriptional regulator with XRE-family HTH domain
MLRSALVSLFWNVIAYQKAKGGFSFKKFAEQLRVDKSTPSRWFSDDRPNWTANTIADIAVALNVEIQITARDRGDNAIFTPSGLIAPATTEAPPADEASYWAQPPKSTAASERNDVTIFAEA